jgi:hypothetical protein
VFSERILGSAPLRAAVTVFAMVVAGLTTPMLQASARAVRRSSVALPSRSKRAIRFAPIETLG